MDQMQVKKLQEDEGEALYPNAFVCDVNVLKTGPMINLRHVVGPMK